MAIYHLHATTGNRKNGKSAGASASYILREEKYLPGAAELLYKESGNMPGWARDDTLEFWKTADIYERANARLWKGIEVSLPVEFNLEQKIELTKDFVKHLTQHESLTYTFAIHRGENDRNPHAHIMMNETLNTDGIERTREQYFKRFNSKNPEKGGCRKTQAMSPQVWLEQTRADWASIVNRHLEHAGLDIRIDHRSLINQGVHRRLPQKHLGPHVLQMEERGIDTERGDLVKHIAQENDRLKELTKKEREYGRSLENPGDSKERGDREHDPDHGRAGRENRALGRGDDDLSRERDGSNNANGKAADRVSRGIESERQAADDRATERCATEGARDPKDSQLHQVYDESVRDNVQKLREDITEPDRGIEPSAIENLVDNLRRIVDVIRDCAERIYRAAESYRASKREQEARRAYEREMGRYDKSSTRRNEKTHGMEGIDRDDGWGMSR